MILSLLFVAHFNVHKCNHDLEMGNITQSFQGPKFSRNLKAAEWKKIRIQLDFSYIDQPDANTCSYEWKSVKFGGRSITCQKQHILTAKSKAVIKGTLNNVKKYLENLLSVIPYNQPITYIDFNYDTDFRAKKATGADIVLAILSRPRERNDTTLASAAALSKERSYFRPIFGVVFLNPVEIPDEVQDENSKDSTFFYVCIHEIFHALGISKDYFRYYHPHESQTPHSEIICRINSYGKTFSFLVTPYAHKFAVKRFGVEEFKIGTQKCPAGIEIENEGGTGTAGSHLEGRTYMSDLMVGMTIQTSVGPFSRLTDAVLAVLLDSGNYKVNWRMGQPLVWGNPESIDGNPIKDFAVGAPQLVFPPHYMRDFSNPEKKFSAGFDFKFSGPPSERYNANFNAEEKKFFDPKGIGIGNQAVYDYIPFYIPKNVCPKGKAILPSTNYPFHKCGDYTCDSYDSFTIKINNNIEGTQWENFTCTKENASQVFSRPFITISGSYKYETPRDISCVDPERFCRSVILNEMKFVVYPFDPNSKQLNSNSPTPTVPESDDNPSGTGEDENTSGTGEDENTSGTGEDENAPGPGGKGNTSGPGGKGNTSGTGGKGNTPGLGDEPKQAEQKKKIIIGVSSGIAALIVIAIIVVVVVFTIKKSKEAAYQDDSDANYVV